MNNVDTPMSNTELRMTLAGQDSTLRRLEEKIDLALAGIHHTNGSVAETMVDIERLKRWRVGITYSWLVVSICVLPVIGFTLLKVWDSPQITTDQVQSAVNAGIQQAVAARDAARASTNNK